MYITLSESDRERLGCPEKMAFKLEDITAREQATLQHEFGYDDTYAVGVAFDGLFEFDAGKLARVRRNADLFLALTWLALRQSGVFTGRSRSEMAVELADLDIQVNKVELEPDEDEKAAAGQGKDEDSTPTRTSTD